MKKKFIFLAMMLLTFLGVNVLNAQIDLTKQYRLKVNEGGYAGNYLHVNSFNAPNNQPQVGIAAKAENTNQIFTLEDAGNGNYYLRCATNDYYIKCAVGEQWWCVYAYSTTERTPLYFNYTDGTNFYLRDYDKMMGIGGTNAGLTTNNYFKVENYGVYCDAAPNYTPSENSYVTTWSLEEVVFSVAVSANKTEIWSDETVNLTAVATDGAGSYTYSWSPATGLNDATSASPVFTPTAVGTYTFTCTATDANDATVTSDEISIIVKDAKDKPKGIVGDDSSDYSTLPGYNYYNYSISQQIYTKDEINLSAGTSIISISFKPQEINQSVRNWSVYLINTQKESFSSYSDYVTLSEGDCFYTGDVNFGSVGEWFEITFTKPFEYNGENILVCVTDNKGSYDYGTNNQYYGIYTDAYYSVLNWNDNCGYDVANPTSNCFSQYQQIHDKFKSSIKFGYEDPTPRPQNLAIVEGEKNQLYPGEKTEISWDALEGAAGYNVYVNDVKFNTEAVEDLSYVLVNLPYGMNTIAVTAVFADDSESGKSKTLTVQMAGTFPLTIKVQDKKGYAVANASLTIEGHDEYQVYRTFEGTTDVNGEWYKADMPLLYEYYSYYIMVSAEPFEDENSYFYESETEYGVAFTKTIEMELPIIYPQTEKQSYDANEDIVLFWNAVDSEYLNGYNVYVNDEENPRNTELLTSAIYTLEGGLAETGSVHVTAVYEGYGESGEGYGAYVNINAYGTISGTVTDGTNPIVGAEVVVEGRDMKYQEQRYTTLTNADGTFELEVLPSYEYDDNVCYSVSVSKYGYSSYKSTEKYKAVVDSDIILGAIVLTANDEATFTVTATATAENDNVTVEWTAPEGATQYNVFRKDEATQAVVKLTEAPITEREYLATDWNELSNGTYQYGVSAFVGGGSETLLSTSFENSGSMPEGWEKTSRPAIVSTYAHTGNYSFRLQIQGQTEMTGTLTSPEITIGDTDPTLSFYYINKNDNNTFGKGKINVQVEIDGVGIFKEETITDEANDFVLYEKKLEGYNGRTIKVILELAGYYYAETIVDDIVVSVSSSPVESSIKWSGDVEKTSANVFTSTGEWTSASNWSNGVPADGANVFIEGDVTIASNVNVNNMTINGGSVTINEGASLTVEGTLVNEAAANLVLNDGAQIFQNNEGVPATFVMGIANPEEWQSDNKDGWQFISSPFTNASVFNFTNGNYDLFKYDGDEDLEWQNHKANAASFGSTFEQGVGYLASHETESTIELTGTLNAENSYSWNYLYYNEEKPLANFYLLGNPFTFDMDITKATFTNLVEGVAVVTSDGGYNYSQTTIPVGDAFFVKANGNDYSSSLSYGGLGARSAKSNSLNITATGNAGKDNVVINFAGKQEGFPKLKNFNDDIATLFVENSDVKYGIFYCNENTTEVEVSFHANQMGNYTIAAVPSGKFSSVILTDKFTGVETDLMVEDYNFTATSGDNANRFIVKLAVSDQQSAVSDNFVYQSGEELIVEAEGTVQIIDVMGRIVYSDDVESTNNRIDVSGFRNGTYMVRVINGSEVKVEKVVIY